MAGTAARDQPVQKQDRDQSRGDDQEGGDGGLRHELVHGELEGTGVRVTRIALGLPVGGDLEYADGVTIAQALAARREMPT